MFAQSFNLVTFRLFVISWFEYDRVMKHVINLLFLEYSMLSSSQILKCFVANDIKFLTST